MTTPIVLSKAFVNGQWSEYYPQTLAAAVITNENSRFVTDAQIADWSAKATTTDVENALRDAKDYTDTEIAALVDGAPEALDTLRELAEALQTVEGSYEGLLTVVGEKAKKEYVDDQLSLKADLTYVDEELGKKADTATVNDQLALKADLTHVNTELGKKADTTYVDNQLDTKADKTEVPTITMGTEQPEQPTEGSVWLQVVS